MLSWVYQLFQVRKVSYIMYITTYTINKTNYLQGNDGIIHNVMTLTLKYKMCICIMLINSNINKNWTPPGVENKYMFNSFTNVE